MKPKLFFFGIDSATWDLIMPWIKKGKLPGFEKLIKQGLKQDLQSTVPPLTPIAWTSLYTGANPGKHGIFDFYRTTVNKNMAVNLATEVKLPSIFHLLSQAKLKVACLNMPLTFPVEKINGIMVSGFLTPGIESEYIYPKKLRQEFKLKFPHYQFTEKARYGMDQKSQAQYFQALKDSVAEKIEMFEWVEAKEDWNLFAINFMEIDHVHHWFWQQPKKMLAIYQLIDQYLLKKLKQAKYGLYMIFSDHGAGPYLYNLNLNPYFLKKGLLKLKPDWKTKIKKVLFNLGFNPSNMAQLALKFNRLPSSQTGRGKAQKIKLFLDLNDIDWHNSLAYSFGYYGSVYLIKKNRSTKTKIKKALQDLKFANQPVITKIWEKQEVYQGPYAKQAPDLLFSPQEYAFGASAISPFLANTVFSKPHTLKTGEHRFKGIFGIYPRFKINDSRFKRKINIYDVSATILDYFGVSIPNYFDGNSLFRSKNEERRINSKLNEVKDIKI